MKTLKNINTENIVEENSLFKISKSNLIIKDNDKDIVFIQNKISNIRIIKKRELSYWQLIFSIFFIIFNFYYQVASFFYNILTLIVLVRLISTMTSKNKLIINLGAFSFYKISLSQKNMVFAESLTNKFKNKSIN